MQEREFTNYEEADARAWVDLRAWARQDPDFRSVEVRYRSKGNFQPVTVRLRDERAWSRGTAGLGKTLASAASMALEVAARRQARAVAAAGGQ